MDKDKKKKILTGLIIAIVLLAVVTPFVVKYVKSMEPKEVTYNEFIKMAEDKKIKEIQIDFSKPNFKFEDVDGEMYSTDNPKSEDFKLQLLLNDINVVETSKRTQVINSILSMITPILSMLIMLYFLNTVLDKTMGSGEMEHVAEDVNVTFSDIAGNEEAKEDMKFLVEFLKKPKKYTDMGAKLPKGVILYGSPGTGKTLTARAIAGEANVPFYNVTGSDFVEMYAGLGAKRVRDLFKEARKNAPCIIFIDEIDALGTTRGVDNHSEKDQTINALLAELDGFNASEGVIVIAATNMVEDLDRALVRPGRFDRHISIELPDFKDRLSILNLHASNKKMADDVNMEDLAKMTIGFSGAGLASLLNEATILAVNRDSEVVAQEDIDEAHFKILVKGNKKKNSERSDVDTELVAYHEAGHALLAKIYTDNDVPKVTIIPSTSGVGGATFNIPKKISLLSKQDILNEVITLYGGRAAEEVLRGSTDEVTTGASNDIERATELIFSYFNDYGMSEKYGMVNISKIEDPKILDDVVKMSKELYEKALNSLKENSSTLEAISKALIEQETITEDELDAIIQITKN